MRQKLAKPSNNSSVSKANRQGSNNGKLFPMESRFFKSKKLIDIHPIKKSDGDRDAIAQIHELINENIVGVMPENEIKSEG